MVEVHPVTSDDAERPANGASQTQRGHAGRRLSQRVSQAARKTLSLMRRGESFHRFSRNVRPSYPVNKIRTSQTLNPNNLEIDKKKKLICEVLDGTKVTVVMTFFTIYALFGDDLRLLLFPKDADSYFYGFSCLSLLLFSVELLLNLYAREEYAFRFYFWLDLFTALSILSDIGWIWNKLWGEDDDAASSTIKAGRASRAGTKATRLVRLFRMVRTLRVVKLYKTTSPEKAPVLPQKNAELSEEPTRVGTKLSDLTSRRIVTIVLLLVTCFRLIDDSLQEPSMDIGKYGLHRLHEMPQKFLNSSGQISPAYFRRNVENFVENAGKVLYFECCGEDSKCATVWPREITDSWLKELKFSDGTSEERTLDYNPSNDWSASDLKDSIAEIRAIYRSSEFTKYEVAGCFNRVDAAVADEEEVCISTTILDITNISKSAAMSSIFRTIFVIIVLGVAAVTLTKDADTLIIAPIERMSRIITGLATNPLAHITNANLVLSEDKKAKDEGYETLLLENTFCKIAKLMQVGYGPAGAEIIGKSVRNRELDPTLPGKKITAVFGFCDIRQFTDTTECLQEDVMVYVNHLGAIVHGAADLYYGSINKNVGDAFLLSWKLCNEVLSDFGSFKDSPDEASRKAVCANVEACPTVSGRRRHPGVLTPSDLADCAFTAFLKTAVDLERANRSGTLAQYASDNRIIKRFGPDFKIQMGFGMHVGWAIEGAIGSIFKIDCTYLSPHVEMAERLEAGTKLFGVKLNFSHWFVALLTPQFRKFLRPLDCIEVHNVPVPLTLYTFDISNYIDFNEIRDDRSSLGGIDDEMAEYDPVLPSEKLLSALQADLPEGFREVYSRGFEKYIEGNWESARTLFQAALSLAGEDGPSTHLLSVIGNSSVAPEDWKGFRAEPRF